MARIELANLAHSYSARPPSDADYALKRIDITFQSGGAYALLGPSGCGKTTTLRMINRLIRLMSINWMHVVKRNKPFRFFPIKEDVHPYLYSFSGWFYLYLKQG